MAATEELSQLEYQALRAELLNWQTLRFTLLGIAAAVDAALVGWIATSGSKLSLGEAAVPLFLVLGLALAITCHVARSILRLATYFEVFYQSPWETRLAVLRKQTRPWRVNSWIAASYLILGASSLIMAALTCAAKTTVDVGALAWLLGALSLVPVVDLATVSRETEGYRSNWLRVKSRLEAP